MFDRRSKTSSARVPSAKIASTSGDRWCCIELRSIVFWNWRVIWVIADSHLHSLALDDLLPSLQSMIKCKSVMVGLPLYSQVQDVLTVLSFFFSLTDASKALQTRSLSAIDEALHSVESSIATVQQLLHCSIPVVRQAQGAAAFLQKIESLEGQVRSLLEGPILQNLPVSLFLLSFTSRPCWPLSKSWSRSPRSSLLAFRSSPSRLELVSSSSQPR